MAEGSKGVLEGTAKVGKQILWAPEFAAAQGLEMMRQLTWHLVHNSTCYLLTLTFTQKYSVVRMALNGFVIMEKRPSLFNQARPARWLAQM